MTKRIVLILLAGVAASIVGLVFFLRPFAGDGRPRLDDPTARPSLETIQVESNSAEPVRLVASSDSTEPAQSAPSWNRFRGPNGLGVSDDASIPDTWSETQNLAWKTKLPGSGASSPVLTEQYVLITSYSGYGEEDRQGSMQQLKRHVSCIDRANGKIVWTKTIDNQHPDDPYQGMGLPEHGYATNTPVTDGNFVFAFLGKSGVVAFDMEGNQQWQTSVGTESGNRRWGTASSLIIYDDLVIVNAAEESQSLIALDKATGKRVWNAEASALELCYGTPVIVRVDETRDDLVIAVPGEVWGLNPRTGRLTWFAQTSLTGNLSPSVIVDGANLYVFGGYRSSGSLAIRAGGKEDVTKSHLLWTSKLTSYVATPVLINRYLHWIDDRGMYYCSNADTGELVHRDRMPQIESGGRPVYASPIAVNGKVFVQTRKSGVLVIEPGDSLKVLSQNRFDGDSSVFNATPAVDAGQLFLRSNEFLYCVSTKKS